MVSSARSSARSAGCVPVSLSAPGTDSPAKSQASRRGGAGAALLDQLVADGVGGDFCIAAHSHLLQDARAIGAYGLYAQTQLVRHDCGRDAAGDAGEDLQLALREAVVQRPFVVGRAF